MTQASFKSLRETADLRQLRQITVGLDEGVILIDPDQSLLCANDAALAMHGVRELAELGANRRRISVALPAALSQKPPPVRRRLPDRPGRIGRPFFGSGGRGGR